MVQIIKEDKKKVIEAIYSDTIDTAELALLAKDTISYKEKKSVIQFAYDTKNLN